MGHHLKSQYIDHMKEKALEKKKVGRENVLYTWTQIASADCNSDKKTANCSLYF